MIILSLLIKYLLYLHGIIQVGDPLLGMNCCDVNVMFRALF